MGVNKYILISNRGPDFQVGNYKHTGIGGTKDLYLKLMNKLCKKWFCLFTDKFGKSYKSIFNEKLDIIFINQYQYDNYYYKFISENLYQFLLGQIINVNDFYYLYENFNQINQLISDKLSNSIENIIFCDYHLYKLPVTIGNKNIKKIFFWFIPFLTSDVYCDKNILKDIVFSLSNCDDLFFLNSEYKENYIKIYKYFFPNINLKTKLHNLVLGPNEDFNFNNTDYSEFNHFLYKKFNIRNKQNNILLSVSRMDIVKNIPILIKGFEYYLSNNQKDNKSILLIIAPHHRRNSKLYDKEHKKIINILKSSKFKNKIFLFTENLSIQELKILYKFANIFFSTSLYDGMPLTPLEYILSNSGNGQIILSDSIGAYNLLTPYCYSFKSNNKISLANTIKKCIETCKKSKNNKILKMRQIVKSNCLENYTNLILKILLGK